MSLIQNFKKVVSKISILASFFFICIFALIIGCEEDLDLDQDEIVQVVENREMLVTDTYTLKIPWNGGKKEYPKALCDSGYWVDGIVNVDNGRHDQLVYVRCRKIAEFLPKDTNTSPMNCEDKHVEWTGKAGLKSTAKCPDGKYVVGFSIRDYGNHDQGPLYKMKCCAIRGKTTEHGNTDESAVFWEGGFGIKTWSYCPLGQFITGVANEDYGNHDQGVGLRLCSEPYYE
jgi:hypothetical protein